MEDARTAVSALVGFGELNAKLGAAMKPSKAQPPSTEHVIQGVLVKIENNRAVVCPTADGKTKLTPQVTNILVDGRLSPQVAGVLAGRFGFVASSLYGHVARPVLHALCQRQNAVGITRERYGLTAALRESLTFLMEVLRCAPPRHLDFATVRRVGIAYADAFFEMDGVKYRPGDAATPRRSRGRGIHPSRFPMDGVRRALPSHSRHVVRIRGRP